MMANSYLKNILHKLKLFFLKCNFLYVSYIVSVFLLAVSPMFLFVWLAVPTLYFLKKSHYKQIINVWVYPLITWYIIFTASLVFSCGINPIIIGHGHTAEILQIMIASNLLFENLCFQTVFILDSLSQKLGCCVYVPVFLFRPK